MALPVVIPNTFANANASIPLSQLDNNFSTVAVAINGMANGAEALSNVNITGGSIANASLSNVSISSGNVTINVANVTTLDATTVEVTNIKAKDGTASATIADSTGVMTIASSVLTTADINGGTIDNAAIGATTPNTGAFTTLTTSSTVTLNGGTANGVAYLNGSKVLTTGSALTFDGASVFGLTTSGLYPVISVASTGTNAIFGYRMDASGGNGKDWRIEQGRSGVGQFNISNLTDWSSPHFVMQADGTSIWSISASEQMRLTSTGLLVGTTSNPFSSKLMVGGTVQVKPATNNSLEIFGPNSGTGIRLFARNDAGTLNRLELQGGQVIFPLTSGADGLYFDASSGNLGLGVTPNTWYSGYTAFEFGGYGSLTSRAATNDTELSSNAYRNASATYIYKKNGTAQTFDMANGAFTWNNAGSGTAGNAISFTQAMTLDASGNLGIGTSSPGNKLVVNGAGAVSAQITSTDSGGSNLLLTASGTAGEVNMANGLPLLFKTGNTERMRIDSSGNLGLGVTPSGSWGTQAFMLGKSGAGNPTYPFIASTNTQSIVIGSNSYWDGTNWKAAFAGSAVTAAQQRINYNEISWHIAGAVSQNTTQSFTQAMTLDASGNLGIGTSSPAYKLDINTNANSFFTGIQVRNLSNGSSATSSIALGQDTNLTSSAIFVNSSTNTSFAGASSFNIYQGLSAPMAFYTNATERARIDSSGNLLIGTTTVGSKLTVADNISLQGAGNTIYAESFPTTASAANVYIGASNSYMYRSTSALKYKQDIRDLEEIDINKFRPIRYKSKCQGDDQTKDHFGIIADEVADAGIEELVTRGENGEVEGFQYERLTVVLLKEIQCLRQRIAALEAK